MTQSPIVDDLAASADVIAHFTARADRYDRSSRWCEDQVLGALVVSLTMPEPTDRVLDIACGTGLVSKLFKGKVAQVTGADITRAMYEQARPNLDHFVEAPAEALPFEDDSFEIVVCRQGIQFMDDTRAVREMVRVAKPGGRVCLVQLCAYDASDRAEYFEILRLRNPARRNYYSYADVPELLRQAGCRAIRTAQHISTEDVDNWADNGAIGASRREAIRRKYLGASAQFKLRHAVETRDGTIVDNMLFAVAAGVK